MKIPNDRKDGKAARFTIMITGHGRQRTFLLCEAHIGRVQTET